MKHFFLPLALWASSVVYGQADSAEVYFNKAVTEKTARKYLAASKTFEKAISFDPKHKNAWLQNGFTNLEMRRSDPAKACFIKVHELDPSDKTALTELINIYFSYRQFPEAISYAQQCKECPNSMRVIGMSYYYQEDYGQAEKALKAAMIKDPEDAELMYTLARTYVDMDQYVKSIPYYEKAVNMPLAKNAWMYELGLLYYNQNDFKQATALFQRAADKGYVQSNDFNENLGFALLYSGEFEKGETLITNVLQKKPGNRDLLRDMAEAFYKQKQYDKSLTYCQQLMEIDAKDGKALYQAGLNFQRKGERDRGQQMCDKAIELDPGLESLRRKKELSGL